jgi:Flp pilus assembly protein TadD
VNLSHAYFVLGRLQDAEQAARRAVSLESHNWRAHYLLGMALARAVRPEALEKAPEAALELRLGAAGMPHAFIEIARIYLQEGEGPSAAEELKLCLKTGDMQHRAKAERALTEILR